MAFLQIGAALKNLFSSTDPAYDQPTALSFTKFDGEIKQFFDGLAEV